MKDVESSPQGWALAALGQGATEGSAYPNSRGWGQGPRVRGGTPSSALRRASERRLVSVETAATSSTPSPWVSVSAPALGGPRPEPSRPLKGPPRWWEERETPKRPAPYSYPAPPPGSDDSGSTPGPAKPVPCYRTLFTLTPLRPFCPWLSRSRPSARPYPRKRGRSVKELLRSPPPRNRPTTDAGSIWLEPRPSTPGARQDLSTPAADGPHVTARRPRCRLWFVGGGRVRGPARTTTAGERTAPNQDRPSPSRVSREDGPALSRGSVRGGGRLGGAES